MMEKKEYINPEMKVVDIHCERILCGSDPGENDGEFAFTTSISDQTHT